MSPEAASEPQRGRWLPALLAVVALLPDLGAALPTRSYYFRDFTATFYPLRLFAARELAAGRWPFWNPYLHEGTFAFPAFYPPDLLLALAPTPVFASFLLTLHLPLAALACSWLGRELGLSRPAAFAAGACFVLGGFAVSSLNLYVFLQALALAPLVCLGLRRAAARGGRAVPLAALAVAASVSTLAVELVGQALLLGTALVLATAPGRRELGRVALAVGVGLGIAGLPIALLLGLLPETLRGAGLGSDVALANAIHPLAVLQVLVPGLLGPLAPPADAFWGGALFSKGFPYFVTLYLGPVALALAWAGLGAGRPPWSRPLPWLALAALWFATGERGGLAPALLSLPGLQAIRFPSKAFFLAHTAVALLAGLGVDALRGGRGWRRAGWSAGVAAGLALGLAGTALAAPASVAAVFGLSLADPRPLAASVAGECARAGLVALACLAVAFAAGANRLPAGRAAAWLCVLLVFDLARAAAGVNPQVPRAFFDPAPGMQAERLDALAGQRAFSLETEQSPAVRAFLARPGPGRARAAFLMHRRVLAPYTNLLDGVETALGKDLTSFAERPPELRPEEYAPGRIAEALPRLRNACVSRVLALDELSHRDLVLRRRAPAGPSGIDVHVYELDGAAPRAYLACRVLPASGPEQALAFALGDGFDPRRDVALEAPAAASCASGEARRVAFAPGDESYEVTADGAGYLVTRDSHARGWTASLDEAPVPVLRANGKHRAVPVPGGRHRVRLRYRPPGLAAGALTSLIASVAALALALRPSAGAAASGS